MDTTRDLTTEARAAAAVTDALTVLGMDDDAELVADTIEGETGLMEALDKALEAMAAAEGMAEGIKAAELRLAQRRERLEHRGNVIRSAIEQAMTIAGLDKVARPCATLSMSRRAPALVVDDEAQIPARFFVAVPKLDRKALKAAAEADTVPGCHMTNGSVSLTIRRK